MICFDFTVDMIVLDNLVADPDNNKGYIDKLLVDLGRLTFEEARTALITHAEDILQDISTRCPRAFEFTIGKTGADKDARCKSRCFDNMNASSWNHKGINDRWKKSYLKAGYNALIVLCAVTSDHLPSLGLNLVEKNLQSRNNEIELAEQAHGHASAPLTNFNDAIYSRNGISPNVGDKHEFISGMNTNSFPCSGEQPKDVLVGDTYGKMFPSRSCHVQQDLFPDDIDIQRVSHRSFNGFTRNVSKVNVVHTDHCYHDTLKNNSIQEHFHNDSIQRVDNFVSMMENPREERVNSTGQADCNAHLSGVMLHNRCTEYDIQGPWNRNIITSAYKTLSDNTCGASEDIFEDDSMAKATRRGLFDQHGYAIALEQQLIHHFTFGKQDKRILNSSLTTGGGEFSKTEAGIVYMAVRFKEFDKVSL